MNQQRNSLLKSFQTKTPPTTRQPNTSRCSYTKSFATLCCRFSFLVLAFSLLCPATTAHAKKTTQTDSSEPKLHKDELNALKDAFKKIDKPTSSHSQPIQTAPTPTSSTLQQLANAMNPSISVLGVFAPGWLSNPAADTCNGDDCSQLGIAGEYHDPRKSGFNLQQVELAMGADVDPYFSARVILSIGESGEDAAEIEIEEAYMLTSALPWRFQLKAGKFLSDLTRFGSRHLHVLDFSTIPLPMALATSGVLKHYAAQLTWLAPLPFYLRLGTEIAYGGSPAYPVADASYPVVMGHIRLQFDLSDSIQLLLGGAISYGVWDKTTDKQTELPRTIVTGHLLLQWRPPNRGRNLAFKIVAEYYGTFSACDPKKTNTQAPEFRQYCVRSDSNKIQQQALHGVVGKAVLRFAQRWQIALRGSWVQQREPSATRPTHRLSAALQFLPTEFSRILLEYDGSNLFDVASKPDMLAHAVWLQLQFSIGSHPAHAF